MQELLGSLGGDGENGGRDEMEERKGRPKVKGAGKIFGDKGGRI